ncbi:MAG: hypothetical protein CVU06_11765 [Bacteroidetes bacterium HGW-Bacteroidetes-22]|nr:MAG: hypothetical protein CVU06_11765 [Bacteroidetes bacterium HGW-Bacteroidetes-22]
MESQQVKTINKEEKREKCFMIIKFEESDDADKGISVETSAAIRFTTESRRVLSVPVRKFILQVIYKAYSTCGWLHLYPNFIT